jgi:hypothetical protein
MHAVATLKAVWAGGRLDTDPELSHPTMHPIATLKVVVGDLGVEVAVGDPHRRCDGFPVVTPHT